jgi:hypothetical protein
MKKVEWPAPGLGIDNAFFTREDGKYYVNISYSNTASDFGTTLIINSPALKAKDRESELKKFIPEPTRTCESQTLTLKAYLKAWGLKCGAERTRGDENPALLPPPQLMKCEVAKRDACPTAEDGFLLIMLAAGENRLKVNSGDEDLPYHAPPLFEQQGYINAFQGLYSNMWQVRPNPSICDG